MPEWMRYERTVRRAVIAYRGARVVPEWMVTEERAMVWVGATYPGGWDAFARAL